MTRFVYVTDTHYGTAWVEYHQQTPYPQRVKELVAGLDEWIREDGSVDFVLHGGDMIDIATRESIRAARELFKLSVPVYLCVGNHDLTSLVALDMWLEETGGFFPRQKPNFVIKRGDCLLYVLPNQWCDIPYYWLGDQQPHFTPGQMTWIEEKFKSAKDVPCLLVTHSPVFGVPSEQTGFPGPYHDPGAEFSQSVRTLVSRQPNIRCVLGGHNHINTCVRHEGVCYATASAFTEAPFEFKLIEVEGSKIRMSTHSLAPHMSFAVDYDPDRTYVQGRPVDREFEVVNP